MATTQNVNKKRRGEAGANGASDVPVRDLETSKRHYHQMVLVRLFEEACQRAFRQGKVGGYLHVYIGQEAVATGLIDAHKPGDKIITAYRDHAHALLLG